MKKVDEGDLAPPSSKDDERIESIWTNENSSPDAVRNSKLVGSGRLVPAQATGIEYTVKFEIKVPPELDGEKLDKIMAEEKRRVAVRRFPEARKPPTGDSRASRLQ